MYKSFFKRCSTSLFLILLTVCNTLAYDYSASYDKGFIAGKRIGLSNGESAGYTYGFYTMLVIYIIIAVLLIIWAVCLIIRYKESKR